MNKEKWLWILVVVCFLCVSHAMAKVGASSQVEEIIVVCKTHYDLGYTHRITDLIPHYRTKMIDKALDTMDASTVLPKEQQFIWTVPAWVLAQVAGDWPGQTPERRARILEAVSSGRMVPHAMPFTPHSDVMHPEDMARGYVFGYRVSKQFGLPLPRAAKATDVPSHGRMMATCLSNAGVKFMHIGCNWPSSPIDVPPLFWWEGPDGSRVLTFYSVKYGTVDPNPQKLNMRSGLGKNFLPSEGWPHKVWLALYVTGDNQGPPTHEKLATFFDEVAKKMPGVKIRMGRMEEFADAIFASGAKLPVIKMETPDSWIHGLMSDPGGTKLLRNSQTSLPMAESLNTQLGYWGASSADISEKMISAYENSNLYSEHTFGRSRSPKAYGQAFKDLDPKSYQQIELSWVDKVGYIEKTDCIAHRLMAANLKTLATDVSHGGSGIMVYNPLPWMRSGYIKVPGQDSAYVYAKHVPACGYKLFKSTKQAPPRTLDAMVMENRYYKIVLDPKIGGMTSLIDKRSGRQWINASKNQAVGAYLNERFTYEQAQEYTRQYQRGRGGKNWLHWGITKPGMDSVKDVPYRAASAKNGTLTILRDTAGQTATLEMPADPANYLQATTLTVRLETDQPYIDLEITIKDKPKDNWPEADWLCFDFDIKKPHYQVGRPLGMMDPVTDIYSGANRHIYSVGTGVAITDADGSGVALCPLDHPLDHPLISLDQPGCWKFTLDFIPKKPSVYLNLYNNQWNTNFRYWYPGTWSSRVRLWTLDAKADVKAQLGTKSLEARLPLVAIAPQGRGGKLPQQAKGLAVSRQGVQVTAFGQDPYDSGKTLLRLWEMAGQSGPITVKLPQGANYKSAIPVNLRSELSGSAISIDSGTFTIELGAYAPASYLLTEMGKGNVVAASKKLKTKE